MKKNKRQKHSIRLRRQKREERKRRRVQRVLSTMEFAGSINELHHATGIAEKEIRKILLNNPRYFTFRLLAQ